MLLTSDESDVLEWVRPGVGVGSLYRWRVRDLYPRFDCARRIQNTLLIYKEKWNQGTKNGHDDLGNEKAFNQV